MAPSAAGGNEGPRSAGRLAIGAWTSRGPAPLPSWAQWFLDLGIGMAQGRESLKQWVIVTVPDRRFAAALAAAGATAELVSTEETSSPRETLCNMEIGQAITWLDGNNDLASGLLHKIDGEVVHYKKRAHGGLESPARRRHVDACASFQAMAEGEEPFSGSKELVSNRAFVEAAIPGISLEQLARTTSDTVVCGTRTRLDDELSESCLSAEGHQGALMDLLRPAGLLPAGQRHWSIIVPSGNRPELVTTKRGLAVFDGASAYLRWRDSIEAPCNLVIIDRWDPRSDDIAPIARGDRMQAWVDEPMWGVPPLVGGIECFSWVEAR